MGACPGPLTPVTRDGCGDRLQILTSALPKPRWLIGPGRVMSTFDRRSSRRSVPKLWRRARLSQLVFSIAYRQIVKNPGNVRVSSPERWKKCEPSWKDGDMRTDVDHRRRSTSSTKCRGTPWLVERAGTYPAPLWPETAWHASAPEATRWDEGARQPNERVLQGPALNAQRDPSDDWQSRGQGFKSPQLHREISRQPSELPGKHPMDRLIVP